MHSKHFSHNELKCKETGENEIDPRALSMLEELRVKWGKPMTLNSAYRSPNHSVEKKKAKAGTHAQGIAFDIRTVPNEQPELIKLAMEVGFKGFGFHKSFLHVDARKQDHISAWYY
jgi:uncharacterized protein YcbK (DUF882 family)